MKMKMKNENKTRNINKNLQRTNLIYYLSLVKDKNKAIQKYKEEKENLFKLISLLINNGSNVNFYKDKVSPILISCEKGFNEISDLLIQNNAQIDIVNENGQTPFLLTSIINSFDIMIKLFEFGSNIFHKDYMGKNALFYANKYKFTEMIKFLQQHSVEYPFQYPEDNEYQPNKYLTDKQVQNLSLTRIPLLENDEKEVLWKEIKENCNSICVSGEGERLCDTYLHFMDLQYFDFGFVYKNNQNQISGFTLFKISIFRPGDLVQNQNETFQLSYNIPMLSGVLRCSNTQGIGKLIQSDQEDFCKKNNIKIMQLLPASVELSEKYYKPKLGFSEHPNNEKHLYKKIGGNTINNIARYLEGGKRTKKIRKNKRKTRKRKLVRK